MSAEGESRAERAASSGGPYPTPLASGPPVIAPAETPDEEAIETALGALAGPRQLSRAVSIAS